MKLKGTDSPDKGKLTGHVELPDGMTIEEAQRRADEATVRRQAQAAAAAMGEGDER